MRLKSLKRLAHIDKVLNIDYVEFKMYDGIIKDMIEGYNPVIQEVYADENDICVVTDLKDQFSLKRHWNETDQNYLLGIGYNPFEQLVERIMKIRIEQAIDQNIEAYNDFKGGIKRPGEKILLPAIPHTYAFEVGIKILGIGVLLNAKD